MMSKTRCALFAGALSAAVAGSANAALIEITYSGIASGSWLTGVYAGQTFTNKAFSIHSVYLTDAITTIPQGYKATNGAADVTVDGYGNFAVISSTANFVSNGASRAGFTVVGQSDVLSFGNGALSSWNMQSNIGPITGTGVFNTQNLFTTLGALRFTGTTTVTFTSTVVPAPSAAALIGLVGAVGARRRRA